MREYTIGNDPTEFGYADKKIKELEEENRKLKDLNKIKNQHLLNSDMQTNQWGRIILT